jgi:chromosome partitioning protein
VLGLLSRKGGVGKSLLAIHLAVVAQASGRRVLLIDADPQGSTAAWWKARAATTPEMETAAPDQLRELLETARSRVLTLLSSIPAPRWRRMQPWWLRCPISC